MLGRKLLTPNDVERGAREILAMGPKGVIIKGGHSLLEKQQQGEENTPSTLEEDNDDEDNVSVGYAQDYLLLSNEMSEEGKPVKDRSRLCDGSRGVWLRSDRYNTIHTHGTGCTLSSSIAAAWAMGQRERDSTSTKNPNGALSSMYLVDACCIAKAYVNAGIARGVQVCYQSNISILYAFKTIVSSLSLQYGNLLSFSSARDLDLSFILDFHARTNTFQPLH